MRKITLLLMSMFFVLGTAMADDKKDETQPLAFGLLKADPADGASITQSVYRISLEFTKDVEATLPEGGIEVKNEAGDVVLKLTSFMVSEYIPKNTVILLFEKKLIVDEKEGEKWVDQYIDAPGKYSYTIPASCIKSVDGEEFPEQTFTFSIPNVFNYVSVLPETTTEVAKLEEITLTFDKEIESVDTNPNKMYVQDANYTTFIDIESATISEDKKTVTLKLLNPVTESGKFYFICYPGVFTSVDKDVNSQYSIEFTVVDPTPSFETNYKEGEKVKEIGNLEITFKNVTEVKLVEGKSINIETEGGTPYVGAATLENNKITVVFDQQFTEEGNYTFVIPAGMFTMDGVENEELELTVELFTFNITPLEIVSVTPGDKNVEKLERIVIEFNQNVRLSEENWQQISREIKLKSGEKEYTLTYNPSSNVSNKLEYIANAEWTGFEYAGTPITEEGTYELDLAALVVDYASESYTDEYGYPATRWHVEKVTCEGTYTWTIVPPASVENIEIEEGEQVIYDLTGRRVEEITNAGIYIVNGKKVLVK